MKRTIAADVWLINLFVYGLFNDPLSNSGYVVSNDGMIMNHELEGMWKEAVVL
jgi:hypothetical protein